MSKGNHINITLVVIFITSMLVNVFQQGDVVKGQKWSKKVGEPVPVGEQELSHSPLYLSWESSIAEIDRGSNLFLWHLTPCANSLDLQRLGCVRSLE